MTVDGDEIGMETKSSKGKKNNILELRVTTGNWPVSMVIYLPHWSKKVQKVQKINKKTIHTTRKNGARGGASGRKLTFSSKYATRKQKKGKQKRKRKSKKISLV